MSWWVYKCNAAEKDYLPVWGDWADFFAGKDKDWGSTRLVPKLAELKRGDFILAYQTNRNELYGVVRVRQSTENDGNLYLDIIETIRQKVRPLKKKHKRIAAIPAFKPGPIKTLYSMTRDDAYTLLKAMGATKSIKDLQTNSQHRTFGAGRGSSERNAEVEKAAVEIIKGRYRKKGWHVRPVENEKRGFDLLCRKGRAVRCAEVKGVRGSDQSFTITRGEVREATKNRNFFLSIVTSALSTSPMVFEYSGKEFLERFNLTPIQFRATIKNKTRS